MKQSLNLSFMFGIRTVFSWVCQQYRMWISCNPSAERFEGIDLLKALACLMVVFHHFSWGDFGLFNYFTKGGMLANSIFSISSGFLLKNKKHGMRWNSFWSFMIMVWVCLFFQAAILTAIGVGFSFKTMLMYGVGLGKVAGQSIFGGQYWFVGLVILFYLIKWMLVWIDVRGVFFVNSMILLASLVYEKEGVQGSFTRFPFCISIYLIGLMFDFGFKSFCFSLIITLVVAIVGLEVNAFVPLVCWLLIVVFSGIRFSRAPMIWELCPYVWLLHGSCILLVIDLKIGSLGAPVVLLSVFLLAWVVMKLNSFINPRVMAFIKLK